MSPGSENANENTALIMPTVKLLRAIIIHRKKNESVDSSDFPRSINDNPSQKVERVANTLPRS